MKIQPILNNSPNKLNQFYVSPTGDSKVLDERIRNLLPKFSEDDIDYALVDTYRDRNGKVKIHTISFFDEGIRNLDIVD